MRYAAAVALLLLVGLLFNLPLLVYAGYALAGIFLITRWLTRRWIQNIEAVRESSATEIEIGQSIDVRIHITASVWVPWVLVEDSVPRSILFGPPPSILLKGDRLRLGSLSKNKNEELQYSMTALRRGYFQLGPLVLETGDFLGLYRQYRVATEPSYIMVLPKVLPLLGYNIASKRPVGEVRVTYRLMEDPTLIAGVRQYEQGDSMGRIHWAATARTGVLHSKVYQPTSVAGATLVIDMHRDSNPDRHEPVRTDLAITAAASISHALYQMQQQFGLISNGRDAADRIRTDGWEADYRSRAAAQESANMQEKSDRLRPVIAPTLRGAEHFGVVLRTLARLERTDGLQLPQLLMETQSRLPRDASVIVIVQEVTDDAALALGLLRRQGYAVSAIVNNYELEPFTQAAGRLLANQIAVYHLSDEDSIPEICRTLVLRS